VGAWQHGVDVYSRVYNAGWDITTSEAHLAHVLGDARWYDYYKVLVY